MQGPIHTSSVSRGKLPLLALVNSSPSCANLSRRKFSPSCKLPHLFPDFLFVSLISVIISWFPWDKDHVVRALSLNSSPTWVGIFRLLEGNFELFDC